MSNRQTGHVVLTHEVGLHARPSVKLTKLAKKFSATIKLSASEDGPWIDAKSVAKVMGAKIPQHATLYFEAEGDDAVDAVAALIALVNGDFQDAPAKAAG